MTILTRSQKLLVSTAVAALGGATLLTVLAGNVFIAADASAAGADISPAFGVVDFPICHTPAASGLPNVMLRLAQTEVPRAEMSAARPTPAFADTEPPMWTGLGSINYKITTANERAQAYFDQGLRLAYAFNHGEASAPSAWRRSSTPTAPCASGAKRLCSVPTSIFRCRGTQSRPPSLPHRKRRRLPPRQARASRH